MKSVLVLVVLAAITSVIVGCKAKVDSDGASVQTTH
jgi:hypothetical protein